MMAKIKALCLNSLTVAWSYFLIIAGVVTALLPAFQEVAPIVSPYIGERGNGILLTIIGLLTFLARMRGLMSAALADMDNDSDDSGGD